jgi:hypothetical protein
VYKYQDACNSEGGIPKVKIGLFKVKLTMVLVLRANYQVGQCTLEVGALENQSAFKSQLDELGQYVIENHGVIENQNVGTYYQSKGAPLLVNSIGVSRPNLLSLTYKMSTLRAPLICIFHL